MDDAKQDQKFLRKALTTVISHDPPMILPGKSPQKSLSRIHSILTQHLSLSTGFNSFAQDTDTLMVSPTYEKLQDLKRLGIMANSMSESRIYFYPG